MALLSIRIFSPFLKHCHIFKKNFFYQVSLLVVTANFVNYCWHSLSYRKERDGKSKMSYEFEMSYFLVQWIHVYYLEQKIQSESTECHWIKHNLLYSSVIRSGIEMLTVPISSLGRDVKYIGDSLEQNENMHFCWFNKNSLEILFKVYNFNLHHKRIETK